MLEGARRFETLCLSMQDTLNAPVAQVSLDPLRTSDTGFPDKHVRQTVRLCLRPQPLSPSSQRRLKQLMDKHGSGKIYQVVGAAVASRDLDLNLAKGELVAVLSESDTRGDRRRWLVDAGGQTLCSWVTFKLFLFHNSRRTPFLAVTLWRHRVVH